MRGHTDLHERELSQRELRNNSAAVLREVAAGESYVVTNHGVPVGRLVPLTAPATGLPITRPARRRGGWAKLNRLVWTTNFDDLLDELRGDRM